MTMTKVVRSTGKNLGGAITTMKKVLSIVLCLTLMLSMMVAFGSASAEASKGVLNVYSFTDEVPKMIEKYIALNPDFGYTVNATVIATTDGLYQPALDQALAAIGVGVGQP